MEINLFGLRIFLNVPYRSLGILIILNVMVIIGYFYMMKLRQQRVIKFGNFETLKRIEGAERFSLSYWLLISEMIIITLLFLVATNSITMNLTKPVSNTDFVIALDTSPSMFTPGYGPSDNDNRLTMTKNIALKWLNGLPESTRVGILIFSGDVTKITEPTTSYRTLKRAIENIEGNNTEIGGTAIGTALMNAATMLNYSSKRRAIVLITDGNNNEGVNLSSVINALNAEKINVYTVGIDNNNQSLKFYEHLQELVEKSNLTGVNNESYTIPKMNVETLSKISNMTGGKLFIVKNNTAMDTAFSNIFLSNQRIQLDSDYYILLFLAVLMIIELLMFAKYGAI